ncbi:hypothetical protein EYZ11_009588 [Aspergillus tanneri]|uniref:Nudix hydrolase domain-containing protein n=1 Tax=Aspergillus tanneri TaxID=1220188 RepID=A0A4S3J9K6_9EURO|nr:uncharacterized protein ATNIH1004_000117 [Aspergillus tanneri]KAA8651239.1 hypothetical protein ATNIH1004_000117 [Aspergillus tanneri]THC90938.1 hypothetical protein EYZ11_009588 [Aspergillus tanneri]
MTSPQPPPFTYSPHLHEYSLPLSTFSALKPQYTDFVVGGLVFSPTYKTSTALTPDPSSNSYSNSARVLLLQRSMSDSYGGYWEGPGGLCERTDASILEGAAREVREETGLHVSHFVELVSVDQWVRSKPDRVYHVAKFTFLLDVWEASGSCSDDGGEGGGMEDSRWEDKVKVEPTEHEAFEWATEEEVREGVGKGTGRYKFVGDQGRNLLAAFQLLAR